MKGSIRELGLPLRVQNNLAYQGIRTIQALLKRTPFDLLRCPGFGSTSLRQVRRALEERGLSLKDDPGSKATLQWMNERRKAQRHATGR